MALASAGAVYIKEKNNGMSCCVVKGETFVSLLLMATRFTACAGQFLFGVKNEPKKLWGCPALDIAISMRGKPKLALFR